MRTWLFTRLTRQALRAGLLLALLTLVLPLSAGAAKMMSEKTVTGFKFPESVAYDPGAKVLYVSQFGSALKPTEKDGQGYISKVSLDGQVLEEKFLPAGSDVLNKPKGIWVQGDHLWTTDIDSVWEFDLKTKQGRRVELPGIQFANDPTVVGNVLYVSDNRGDALYAVVPADFLARPGEPLVNQVFSGAGVNPNGLYPAADGSLLLVGFKSDKEARGVFKMKPGGSPEAMGTPIGRLDGVYEMKDGSLLVTDWDSGSLLSWSNGATETLAKGFKGPADFAVAPQDGGLLVVVPDLVQSQLRFVHVGM